MSAMNDRKRNPLLWLAMAIVFAVGLMALFVALSAPNGWGYGMMGWGAAWGECFLRG